MGYPQLRRDARQEPVSGYRSVRCSSCDLENAAGKKFCIGCGAALGLLCPRCGSGNPVQASFCGDCGIPLGRQPTAGTHLPAESEQKVEAGRASTDGHQISTKPPPDVASAEGERRHLTILFGDLVGSTEIAANLDPEDWREMATAYQRVASEAVARFGGHVAQYLGDGVMAFFGYPHAHENDPERAARAGLAILESISLLNKNFSAERRPTLAARVGIHAGSVVVGRVDGRNADVFGEVPNIAARVQAMAEPNTVLISESVHRLISGLFVVEEAGARQLKGVLAPVKLYRLLRPSGIKRRHAAAATRSLTPFVGREEEIRLLLGCWERAREGEGQVVLVVGEAGVGKSRILSEMRQRIADTPHTFIEGAGDALFENTPFYAVTEMLRQGFSGQTDDGDEGRLHALERAIGFAGLKPEETIPLIGPLLDFGISEKYPPLPLPGEQQRRRQMATLAAWVLASARVQPMLIVLEDLHWVDPSTIELSQLIAEQSATVPVLLLCTARPEFRMTWPMRAHHTQVNLNRFSRGQVREMLARLTGATPLGRELVETLADRSGGVPLFVEELTRAALESDGRPTTPGIPATLQDSLMARLDQLGSAKEIAQVASVIGNEFSYGLLRAVASMKDERLQAALKELADAELLFAQGVPPEAHYLFKHALIREAGYQSLLRSKRQLYHRHIAEALQDQFSAIANARPELLAHHCMEAGLPEQAIRQWYIAGQQAIQRSANVEAVSHLSKALDLLMRMPENPERAQQELTLQVAIGTPLIASKGFASPVVERVYARARRLCQDAGEAPELFPVLSGLWMFYTSRGEHMTARDLAERCLRIAQSVGDTGLLVHAHQILGVGFITTSDFVRALDNLEQALEKYDPREHCSLVYTYGQDPAAFVLTLVSWPLWFLGYPDQALRRCQEAQALAQTLNHPYTSLSVAAFSACFYQFDRNPRAVEELAEQAISISTDHGFVFYRAWGLIMRGWALAEQGQVLEGIAQMRVGLDEYRTNGGGSNKPFFLSLLGEAYGKLGQFNQALNVLAEAQDLADENRECWWQAELHRIKGELILAQRDRHTTLHSGQIEAEECFHKALAIARAQKAKSLGLRAAMSLSRLWIPQSRHSEAQQLLHETLDTFEEGFETRDLMEAKLLMEVTMRS
jgi:predicted ATPase/class 3 adenylate cyclase